MTDIKERLQETILKETLSAIPEVSVSTLSVEDLDARAHTLEGQLARVNELRTALSTLLY